ncbi:MAG TPA: hypothetical protein VFZ85_16540 [Jiangellaceae bacterium]
MPRYLLERWANDVPPTDGDHAGPSEDAQGMMSEAKQIDMTQPEIAEMQAMLDT